MDLLFADLRQTLRQLWRSPGYCLLAIVLLGAGIGVNTAVYSVVYEVLLRSLPYQHPDRIVQVSVPSMDAFDASTTTQSWAGLEEWRAANTDFKQLAGLEGAIPQNLEVGDSIIEVTDVKGTANLLQVAGIAPAIGRIMQPGEDVPEAEPVIVLSNSVWQSLFGKDPGILGKRVLLQGKPHTVIGVMPPQFTFPFGGFNQVWTGTDLNAAARFDRSATVLQVIGLLKPGSGFQKAAAALTTLQSNTAQAYSSLHLGNRVVVDSYQAALTGRYRHALSALQAAVLLVWLIACINVSGLMLTRGVTRRHEIILKRALGASGFRLARQTLMESFVISIFGGAAGLIIGMAFLRLVQTEITRVIPTYQGVQLNSVVLASLFGASIITSLLDGILPVLYSIRAPAHDVVRTSSLVPGIGIRRRRLLNGMVTGEIALTLVLLAAAGLMLRTLEALYQVPMGFNESKVLTASLTFQDVYSKKNINTAVYEPLLDALKRLPGVQDAAVSSVLPMRSEFSMQASFRIEGNIRGTASDQPHADLRIASPDLPRSLGVRLLQGRFFNSQDSADSQAVAVVNHSFVVHYLAGADPLSFKLSFGKKGQFSSVTLVGVIDDMKQIDLAQQVEPEVYLCVSQVVPGTTFYPGASAAMQLAVRTSSDPENIITSVRKILRTIAPDAYAGEIKTMHQNVDDSIGNDRFAVKLLWLSAATAFVISLTGLFGVLQFSVSQATRAIGVRLAVGAQTRHIVRLVIMHAGVIVGSGLAIGVFLSCAMEIVIRSFLFGVRLNGIDTILAATVAFATCAALAAYIPARRAAAVDPMRALREQ